MSKFENKSTWEISNAINKIIKINQIILSVACSMSTIQQNSMKQTRKQPSILAVECHAACERVCECAINNKQTREREKNGEKMKWTAFNLLVDYQNDSHTYFVMVSLSLFAFLFCAMVCQIRAAQAKRQWTKRERAHHFSESKCAHTHTHKLHRDTFSCQSQRTRNASWVTAGEWKERANGLRVD